MILVNDLKSKYEQMVVQLDEYFKQVETAELCLTAIINYIFRYGNLTNKITVQEVLDVVHQIEIDLRTKILHLRLEKALVACDLKEVH